MSELEQYLAQLRLLERFVLEELEGPRYAAVREEARPRLADVFARMRELQASYPGVDLKAGSCERS